MSTGIRFFSQFTSATFAISSSVIISEGAEKMPKFYVKFYETGQEKRNRAGVFAPFNFREKSSLQLYSSALQL